MKFESKFGIGEILVTHQKIREGRINQDVIGECIGISFQVGTSPVYCLRIGEPTFDQEASYPTDPEV